MTAADDSNRSYSLAIAIQREIGVRSGRMRPSDEVERRQAAEGPVSMQDLDAMKEPR